MQRNSSPQNKRATDNKHVIFNAFFHIKSLMILSNLKAFIMKQERQEMLGFDQQWLNLTLLNSKIPNKI